MKSSSDNSPTWHFFTRAFVVAVAMVGSMSAILADDVRATTAIEGSFRSLETTTTSSPSTEDPEKHSSPEIRLFVSEHAVQGQLLDDFPPREIHGVDTSELAHFEIADGNDESIFCIDPDNGRISVADASRLDFETASKFKLLVSMQRNRISSSEASLEQQFLKSIQESGATSRDIAPRLRQHARLSVEINVVDVNESPVAVDQRLSVAENSLFNASVGTIRAADPDVNDVLSFTFKSSDQSLPFTLDPETGSITVANPGMLDFEENSVFDCMVQVSDRAGATTEIALQIEVIDINETPLLTAPGLVAPFDLMTPWKLRLCAVDDDCEDQITYRIVDEPLSAAFHIDAESGDLTIADVEILKQVSNSSCTLRIEAIDQCGSRSICTLPLSWTDSSQPSEILDSEPPTADAPRTTSALLMTSWRNQLTMTVVSLLALMAGVIFLQAARIRKQRHAIRGWKTQDVASKDSVRLQPTSGQPVVAAISPAPALLHEKEEQYELQLQVLRDELQRTRNDACKQREMKEAEIAAHEEQLSTLNNELTRVTEELRLATVLFDESWSENEVVEELKLQVRQRNQMILELRSLIDQLAETTDGPDSDNAPFHDSCELAEPWEKMDDDHPVCTDDTTDDIVTTRYSDTAESAEDEALLSIRNQLAGLFSLTNATSDTAKASSAEAEHEAAEATHENSVNDYMSKLLSGKGTNSSNYVDDVLSKYSSTVASSDDDKFSSKDRRLGDRRRNNDPALVPEVDRRQSGRRNVDVTAIRNDMNSFREVSRQSVETALTNYTLRKAKTGLFIRKLLLMVLLLGMVFTTFANLMQMIKADMLMWTLDLLVVLSATELGVRILKLRTTVEKSRKNTSQPAPLKTISPDAVTAAECSNADTPAKSIDVTELVAAR